MQQGSLAPSMNLTLQDNLSFICKEDLSFQNDISNISYIRKEEDDPQSFFQSDAVAQDKPTSRFRGDGQQTSHKKRLVHAPLSTQKQVVAKIEMSAVQSQEQTRGSLRAGQNSLKKNILVQDQDCENLMAQVEHLRFSNAQMASDYQKLLAERNDLAKKEEAIRSEHMVL